MTNSIFNTLQSFSAKSGKSGKFFSLPQLEKAGVGKVSRLPVCLRVVLESLLRNANGKIVKEDDIRALANWQPQAERTLEIPFVVARVLLQDFTGVPLGVDLAAMRSAVSRLGKDPTVVEPLVPVDLVIDHSVQVDYSGTAQALGLNMKLEFKRNRPRYEFLKWCEKSFKSFKVVPPGIGICHQVNLEYLAQGVIASGDLYYPDTLVGTDSHTTMINGLGVLGWGVGGIEAEAAMLGQPIYFLTPDVVGVHLKGKLGEGVTATDLVLSVTQLLRKTKVVGKLVEFFGEGAESIPVTDRATIGNMSPEYGATAGFFPVDEKTCEYLLATGRSKEHVDCFRNYYRAQGMFGMPKMGDCEYTAIIELDLSTIKPSVAGPKRPQDRIDLSEVASTFNSLLTKSVKESGYGKSAVQVAEKFHLKTAVHDSDIAHGQVLIAAITSCTNTSNPSVMIAAGLLAKKAVEKGLKVPSFVKASLAPGSRVVSEYLEQTGLQPYLNQLGFNLVGYGCTTCIGNSGPLEPEIEALVKKNDVIAASVLSGNRNFEARIHQNIKANFLMSPPLVVAYALAGTVAVDITKEPLGIGLDGKKVYLSDIWPSLSEIAGLMSAAFNPQLYQKLYGNFAEQSSLWNQIPQESSLVYKWDTTSTYIQEPPYFDNFSLTPSAVGEIKGARVLAVFGDSVTTDHISPAGEITKDSPAGVYLQEQGVVVDDFNSFGSRRGNHHVMVRGTFGNVRIKNLLVPGTEGFVTKYQPTGETISIYDAAMKYQVESIPLVVIAGEEYGTGSSRDWAAKGTKLLGVRAVIAKSFERIHRSNLVGMGVLPCQFLDGCGAADLGLVGDEVFDIKGLGSSIVPGQEVVLGIKYANGEQKNITLKLRIDTAIEVDYYRHGGILQFVLRQLLS